MFQKENYYKLAFLMTFLIPSKYKKFIKNIIKLIVISG